MTLLFKAWPASASFARRTRFRFAICWLAALSAASILLDCGRAEAFVLSNGTTVRCTVQTVNGPYDVPEQSGFANGFAGFTQMGPNGLPFIIFDPSKVAPLAAGSPITVDFLFYHECAHARFATRFTNQHQSELGANCEGLRKMRSDGRITPAQENEVAQFHITTNVYAGLYGSGAVYWNMTLACANQPPTITESVFGSGGGPMGGGPGAAAFCCTVTGQRIGPFPPPHIPAGAPCTAPVMGTMVPGQACP